MVDEDFASGLPTQGWEYESSYTDGRIQAINGRMRMDVSFDDNFVLNQATVTVDLAGAISATLSFDHLNHGDEEHLLPATFTGFHYGDGVSISADGSTWYNIVIASELNASFRSYNIDLIAERDAIRTAYDPHFELTSSFEIRFQQYDNYPYSSDGRSWDNILLDAEFPPPQLFIKSGDEFLEGTENIQATLSISRAQQTSQTYSLSGPSALSLPSTVTIYRNNESATFTYSIIDDDLQQGDTTTTITASAHGHIDGQHTLTIYDDESPYTVTFDLGGKGVRTGGGELVQQVIWGGSTTWPEVTGIADWHFEGWEVILGKIAGDLTVTGTYYKGLDVAFDLGAHGTVIHGDLVQVVREGGTAIAPEFSVAEGWAFVNWNQAIHDVNSDIEVAAQFAPKDLAGVMQQKINASDAAANDYFGQSVSLSGDTAIVGSYGNDDHGSFSGSAYVFIRQNGAWVEQTKLIASDAAQSDYFGISVAISGDTAIVGASGNGDFGFATGSAYVFVRQNGTWVEQDKLTASDANEAEEFGNAVALCGNTAIIGAFRNDDNGLSSGSAYVFVRRNGAWTEQAKITASDAAQGDLFGYSIALSGDIAIIGAPGDDDEGLSSGSVYVFEHQDGVWDQQGKLTPLTASSYDRLGESVALSGNTAILSANGDKHASNVGSAHVFVRQNGVWVEQALLTAADDAWVDYFGSSVAISGDMAIVGATRRGYQYTAYTDSAFQFKRLNGAWTQEAKVYVSELSSKDRFGNSVAMSGDLAIVGALRGYHQNSNSGSAYIYDFGVPPVTIDFDLDDKASRLEGGELTQSIKYGESADEPVISSNTGWLFYEWDSNFSNIISDLTVTALYQEDSDLDLMPDAWEITNFATLEVAGNTSDSDGDGRLDYDEFVSGNSPTDQQDFFHISEGSYSTADGQVMMRFSTNNDHPGRHYRILYSADMSDGSWAPIPGMTFIPDAGNSTEVSFDLPGDGAHYFFTVETFLVGNEQ